MELELLILTSFVVLLIVIFFVLRKRTDRLNLILESLGLQKSFFLLSYKMKKKYKNEPVYLCYLGYSGQKSSEQNIEFAFSCQSAAGFSVNRSKDMGILILVQNKF